MYKAVNAASKRKTATMASLQGAWLLLPRSWWRAGGATSGAEHSRPALSVAPCHPSAATTLGVETGVHIVRRLHPCARIVPRQLASTTSKS